MSVDGEVVTRLGTKADPTASEIAVDGRPIALPDETHALILNKPPGVLSTRSDDRGRPTVMQFVPPHLRALVYPVGRLDMDSTGLLLLTNDGTLAFRVTHPSCHVPKTYLVTTARPVATREVLALRNGVELEDGMTAPAEVTADPQDRRRLTIVLYEGRKRQIRRMMQAIGNEVVRLHRVAIGPLELGGLAEGQVRNLTDQELTDLRAAVGIDE